MALDKVLEAGIISMSNWEWSTTPVCNSDLSTLVTHLVLPNKIMRLCSNLRPRCRDICLVCQLTGKARTQFSPTPQNWENSSYPQTPWFSDETTRDFTQNLRKSINFDSFICNICLYGMNLHFKKNAKIWHKIWKTTVFQWKYPCAKGGLYRLYFNKLWLDWLEFPTYFPPFPKGNTWNDSSYVAFGEIDGWYFAGGTQLGCSMHTVSIHRLHRIHDDRVYVRL